MTDLPIQSDKQTVFTLANKPYWFQIAYKEKGEKEIPGDQHNERIIQYHQATSLKATDDETPWCSAFCCWVMEQAGIPSPRNAWSRSWLEWGDPLGSPKDGCLCIFKRGKSNWKGHVGFYVGTSGPYYKILGGNQSNSVSIKTYLQEDLIGMRWPKEQYLDNVKMFTQGERQMAIELIKFCTVILDKTKDVDMDRFINKMTYAINNMDLDK